MGGSAVVLMAVGYSCKQADYLCAEETLQDLSGFYLAKMGYPTVFVCSAREGRFFEATQKYIFLVFLLYYYI